MGNSTDRKTARPLPTLGGVEPDKLQRWGHGTTLLGVDLATIRRVAADIEPHLRADGTKIWSLMLLERQLRPEAYRRRRGGFIDRRRTAAGAPEPSMSPELEH